MTMLYKWFSEFSFDVLFSVKLTSG